VWPLCLLSLAELLPSSTSPSPEVQFLSSFLRVLWRSQSGTTLCRFAPAAELTAGAFLNKGLRVLQARGRKVCQFVGNKNGFSLHTFEEDGSVVDSQS